MPWPTKSSEDEEHDKNAEKAAARQKRRRQRTREQHNNVPQVVGAGVALAVSAYCGVVGAIKGFHAARRRALRQMLLDLVPVLEQLQVTYWIDFGTLLGIYRDHDLILHDNDVDIAVLDPDWPALEEALIKQLACKGYWTKSVRPSEDPDTVWLRLYCRLGMVDIFGTRLDTCPANNTAQTKQHISQLKDYTEKQLQNPVGEVIRHKTEAYPLGQLFNRQSSTSSCGDVSSPRSSANSFDGLSDGQTDKSHVGLADVGDVKDSEIDEILEKDGAKALSKAAMLRVELGHGDLCDIPAHLVLPTTRLVFRGVSMRVPGNIEGALRHRYGPTWNVPRYMDKGADSIEQQKLYARIFSALGRFGIRL